MGRWQSSLFKNKALWLFFAFFSMYVVLKTKRFDLNFGKTDSDNAYDKKSDDLNNSTKLTADNSNRDKYPDQKSQIVTKDRLRFEGVYNGNRMVGLSFDEKWTEILKKFNLLESSKDEDEADEAVLKSIPHVVTAFSDNHYSEAERLLGKLQKVHGDRKLVYVYDLGLSDDMKKAFLTKWDKMIVEFRQFKFDLYPNYVKNLFEYRWKPLIIAEMFLTIKSFWWLDTSVQMNGTVKSLYEIFANCSPRARQCRLYPWIMPDDAGHSVYTTTDKRMADYLPYPEGLMKNYTMYGANLMLLYRTAKVVREILKYLVLCALEKGCMAPEGNTIYCHFVNGDRYGAYANCHRYDQSAVNVLLAWANDFNVSRYTHHADNAFELY